MAAPLTGYGYNRPGDRPLTEAEERRLRVLYEQRSRLMQDRTEYLGTLRQSIDEEKVAAFDREVAVLEALQDALGSLSDVEAASRSGERQATITAAANVGKAVLELTSELENKSPNGKITALVNQAAEEARAGGNSPTRAAWHRAAAQEANFPGSLDTGTYLWLKENHPLPPGEDLDDLVGSSNARNIRRAAERAQREGALDLQKADQIRSDARNWILAANGEGPFTQDVENLSALISKEVEGLRGIVDEFDVDTTAQLAQVVENDAGLLQMQESIKSTDDQIDALETSNPLQAKYDAIVSSDGFKAFAESKGIDTTTSRGQAMAMKMLVREARRGATSRGRSVQRLGEAMTGGFKTGEKKEKRAAADPFSERGPVQDLRERVKGRIDAKKTPQSGANRYAVRDAQTDPNEFGEEGGPRDPSVMDEERKAQAEEELGPIVPRSTHENDLDTEEWADDIAIEEPLRAKFEKEASSGLDEAFVRAGAPSEKPPKSEERSIFDSTEPLPTQDLRSRVQARKKKKQSED